MCLNRQCQNVSVFGVHECSAKCSGRGVSTVPCLTPHTKTFAHVRHSSGAARQSRGALTTMARPSLLFRPAQTNSFVQDHAFVAIATAVSSGLWWLQNSYGKSYDISDTLGIKESALGGGENS